MSESTGRGTARAEQRAAGEQRLPASVAAAWGVRDRPHKGPKPGLSLERIVAAAVQVADAEGLAAVSMNRVATELGTAPMSLYRYVTAKDELLALMLDAASASPPTGPPTSGPLPHDPAPSGPPPDPAPSEPPPGLAPSGAPPSRPEDGAGWRAGLSRWAWAMRAAMQRHPWVLHIPIRGLPTLPNEVAWFEEGLRSLQGTGLEENEKASAILLVSGYVRNAAMIDADIEAAVRASGKTPDEWMASYAQTLTVLADPQRFPALTKFIAAGVFDRADPPEAEFTFGLDRVLDGLAALIHTRPY
jgi:AcrR family transcriptional regulator